MDPQRTAESTHARTPSSPTANELGDFQLAVQTKPQIRTITMNPLSGLDALRHNISRAFSRTVDESHELRAVWRELNDAQRESVLTEMNWVWVLATVKERRGYIVVTFEP